MATELRDTGIGAVGPAPWGTHFCHFYETKQDLLDTVVPYFKAGLENKEFCLWVVSDSDLITVEDAKGALAQAVPDLDRHLSDENIEILNGADWYLEKNVLNLDRVKKAWDEKLKRALARGFDGLRASGDTFWLAEKDWKDFFAYEKQVDDWITDQPMSVLCTYPLAKSGAAEVLDVAQTHKFAIARRQGEWEVIENLELTQARAEIRRLNETLQQSTEQTARPSAIFRYGAAVLSVAAVVIITEWMRANLGQQSTPIVALFLSAVMFSAWFGGFGPGLVATALSLLALDYFFVSPLYSLAVDIREIPRLVIFSVSALFVGALSAAQRSKTDSLRQARDVLNETIQELKRTNHALRTENAERQRAEDQLRKQKEIFQKVFDNVPVMIGYVRVDGVPELFNREWERTIGWSQTEIEEENLDVFAECFPDPQQRRRFRDFITAGKGKWEDFKVKVRDGRVIDMTAIVVRLLDGTSLGIARDTTERKQAEALLHAREQEFRAIVENAPDQIIRYDREFRRTYVNPAVAQFYGMPAETLIGAPLGSDIAEAEPGIKGDEIAQVRQRIADVFNTGETKDYELAWTMPDGVRYFSIRLFPELDLRGSVVNVLGISRDITEHKQAESNLKQSEFQFAEAQRLAHVGSFEWNLGNGAVTWSDELYRIFGLQPGKIKGAGDALSSIHPDDRDFVWNTVGRAIEDKQPYSIDYRVIRPDGEERVVHTLASIVSDENGTPIRVFGATQDVTELKRAEENLNATSVQLRALSARLQSAREEEGTRIAREIHDELGSSLTRLKWDLEIMSKEELATQDQEHLEKSRRKISEMIAMVDETVDTVRRISAELRPSALDDLGLGAALRLQAHQFQDRTGIIVECDCAAESVKLIQQQSTAVFRICEEALTNVMRHSYATRVEVRLRMDQDDLVLTIRDNGTGITPTEMSDSLSLGLLGMRERAHLIGGEIEIKGIEDEGTVVTARVPISRKLETI
jgi:PAS domain S-box-containing protein